MNNNVAVPKDQLSKEEEASRLRDLDSAIRTSRRTFVFSSMVSVALAILCGVSFLRMVNADHTLLPIEIISLTINAAFVVILVGITATALMYYLEALAQRYYTFK